MTESTQSLVSVLNPPVKDFGIKVLLIDDQPIVAEAVKRMLAEEKDISFYYCQDPSQAIEMARQIAPTLILQDLVMPAVDGLTLVRYFRILPEMSQVPLIVLSSKEDPKVKAEAFALGANDYMVKLPDRIELIARIRYHSDSYIRLLQRNEAYEQLEKSQQALTAELSEAASYVRSLLPMPLNNKVKTAWEFIPSQQLGGDAFGYHWIDPEHFAIYLFDVCGHGVGAALHSISILNVLRLQYLPDVDFRQPKDVLEALNKAFPMEHHNQMFFTIWYGVYREKEQQLLYGSAGHPPALLFQQNKSLSLSTGGLVIGAEETSKYSQQSCTIEPPASLYLYSDGIYEMRLPNGYMMEFSDFVEELKKWSKDSAKVPMEELVRMLRNRSVGQAFEDDVSLLEVTFNQ